MRFSSVGIAKNTMPLRTLGTQESYEIWKKEHRGEDEACILCAREPKTVWRDSWKIVSNDFPYDEIAHKHDMAVPVRHFAEKNEMTSKETAALEELLEKINTGEMSEYDALLENFQSGRTQKGHYHIHLLAIKNH